MSLRRTAARQAAAAAAAAAEPAPLQAQVPQGVQTRGRQRRQGDPTPPVGAAPTAPAASGGARRRGRGAARRPQSPAATPPPPPPPPPTPQPPTEARTSRRRNRSQSPGEERRVRRRIVEEEQEPRGVRMESGLPTTTEFDAWGEIDSLWGEIDSIKRGVDAILNAVQSQQQTPTPPPAAAGGGNSDAPGHSRAAQAEAQAGGAEGGEPDVSLISHVNNIAGEDKFTIEAYYPSNLPLHAFVELKVKQEIWDHKYVDFASLLPRDERPKNLDKWIIQFTKDSIDTKINNDN